MTWSIGTTSLSDILVVSIHAQIPNKNSLNLTDVVLSKIESDFDAVFWDDIDVH